MRWILGIVSAAALVMAATTMTIPAQTITPDEATLKLFPPETTSIAFVDFTGLRSSPAFRQGLLQAIEEFARSEIEEITGSTADDFGYDLDRFAVGVVGERDLLVVARGHSESNVLKQLMEASDMVSEAHLDHVIYILPGERYMLPDERRMGISFIGNDIIGGNVGRVRQAIDRLAAPAASVIENVELMGQIRSIEAGSQVWGAGRVYEWMLGDLRALPMAGYIVQAIERGILQVRVDSDMYLRANLYFTSEDQARAISDMARGFIAMAQSDAAPSMQRALEGVRIENSGQLMVVNGVLPGDALRPDPPRGGGQ